MPLDVDSVLAQIDREELANLAIALGNIDSPTGREKEVGEFIEGWLRQEGFSTRVLSLLPDRPNIVGLYKGSGGGYSLLFNSHMDTSASERDVWVFRDPMASFRHQAWREGDNLYGEGIVNDKGLMACFLIAGKAIKKAGITLKGDLLLTAVSGEMEQEPVDEFQGPDYVSPDVGCRFMVAHGAVADYALVAEATAFRLGWVEAGRALFKVTVFGAMGMYSPYIKRPYTPEKNPSAIVQVSRLVEKIEGWALSYEEKHTYECPGGTVIPKVNFGAVRGGGPYFTCMTTEKCALYLDFRTVPNQDVLALKTELEEMIKALGIEAEVELFACRRGYEAQNVDRLTAAVGKAHQKVFQEKPKRTMPPESSMWRDINVFNEAGIPAVNYGPSGGLGGRMGAPSLDLKDLYKAAQIFAMIALDLCNQEKKI